ncbi:MAG: hypothetical protein JWR80_8170 [Bradyrhizobium sp.]|nr:hypothetical protein [Bradyrhizobium sp.]
MHELAKAVNGPDGVVGGTDFAMRVTGQAHGSDTI